MNLFHNWIFRDCRLSMRKCGDSARERFKFFQEIKNKISNLLERFEKM